MPYVDPHASQPYDYRTDPTVRSNPEAFWTGYGRYREGVNYDVLPQSPDCLAGWCYGLSEGKRAAPPKPLWESKSFYHGLAIVGLCVWGAMNPSEITENPEAVASLGVVLGVIEIVIRKVTRAAIR